MHRDELLTYLAELLQIEIYKDFGPNGLQVEGRDEVRRIVTAVSAGIELFEAAIARDADAILVHHGVLWDWQPSRLVGPHGERVRLLMTSGINLLQYHLPLDGHPEIGNNALGAQGLGLVDLEGFAPHGGVDIGIRGRFPEPITADELLHRVASFYDREPFVHRFGPDPVRSLGIVSGGAQKSMVEAIDLGLDAFLTGEVSEWCRNGAQEAGLHYISAGHYATEVCGIRTLGEHLADRFGLEVEFVDIPNPV
ncbi:MAG: Nif3-like dinuclear metal center hexameric protein [Acidobacteriota bacterium]